jgi:hypothetical protein
MGNVQSSSIGSQIHPTVSYVQDVESLRFNRRFEFLLDLNIPEFLAWERLGL